MSEILSRGERAAIFRRASADNTRYGRTTQPPTCAEIEAALVQMGDEHHLPQAPAIAAHTAGAPLSTLTRRDHAVRVAVDAAVESERSAAAQMPLRYTEVNVFDGSVGRDGGYTWKPLPTPMTPYEADEYVRSCGWCPAERLR